MNLQRVGAALGLAAWMAGSLGAQSALTTRVEALEAGLTAETSARQTGDTSIRTALTSETSSRQAGDLNLQSIVSSERVSRQAADINLQTALNTEAGYRQTGHANLMTSLNAEISSRQAGDAALQGAIAALADPTHGVVELNHELALRGSATPGEAEGYPITISQAGSYRLTSNLSGGILLTTGSVTIDLNGFVMDGRGFVSIGIDADTVGNITIRNGEVRNFVQGIRIAGGGGRAQFLIENVRSVSNRDDGFKLGTAGIIRNSLAAGNDAAGFAAFGSVLVLDNVLYANTGSGLFGYGAYSYRGNVLTNNGVQLGGMFGINAGGNVCNLTLCK